MKLRIAGACLLAFLVSGTVTAADLTVIDSRPEEDKENDEVTQNAMSCSFLVFRVGDSATDPSKVKVLEADLEANPALALDGKTLEITSWAIYQNRQAGMRYKSSGLLPYLLATEEDKKKMGARCKRHKTKHGWYDGSEVTTLANPLVSEFHALYDGRSIFVRTVYSPAQELKGKFKGDPLDTEATLQAIHKTAEALATALAK